MRNAEKHSPPRLNSKKGLTGQAERHGKSRKKKKTDNIFLFSAAGGLIFPVLLRERSVV
jgi:hypothetical protein